MTILILYSLVSLFFTYEFAKSDGFEIKLRAIRKQGVINHFSNGMLWLFMVMSPWLIFCSYAGLIIGLRFLFISCAIRVLIYGPVVNYYIGKELFYVGTTAKWDRFIRWTRLPVWAVSIITALLIGVFAKYFTIYLQNQGFI